MSILSSSRMMAAVVGLCLLAGPVKAQEAEVMHWWASETDAAAVAKFAEAYAAAGGKWVDIASAGSKESLQATMTRIIAGDPPEAAQFNISTQFYDLADGGKVNSLEAAAKAGKWRDVIPSTLLDVTERDGQIFALPISMSGVNIVFYNKALLAEIGVTEEPKSWDDILAALEKAKAKGKLPMAMAGGVYPQLAFWSIVSDYMGGEGYLKLLSERDPELDPEGLKRAFTAFATLRGYVDAGWSGRKWPEASRMLANGDAVFQIAGDWAKAQFNLGGLQAGKDFGCILPAGKAIMGGDVIVFPRKGDTLTPAQEKLIAVFSDQAAQTAFNKVKGSLPARVDVNPADFDACGQTLLSVATNPEARLPRSRMVLPSDIDGDMGDFINEFFASEMDADEGVARFSELLQQ